MLIKLSTLRLCFLALTVCGLSTAAQAQNTSGVSSPRIKPGTSEVGYRIAFAPQAGQNGLSHRLHYQQSLSDQFRIRVIATQNNRGGYLHLRHIQIESLYQFLKTKRGWNAAIQLQGRIPDGNDGPGRVRVGWLNSFDASERVEIRAGLYATQEIGHAARDAIFLETRSEATLQWGGVRVGAQMFNAYNTGDNFTDWGRQKHQAGPVLKGKITKGLGYNLGALFGLTPAAGDVELRLFLSQSL